MYKRLLHIVFLYSLLFSITGRGQTYPVQAFLQVSPPYSSYLPDYADPFSNQMKVLLTLTDFSVPSYQVKLRFKIEGSGYTMQNTDLVSLPSFTLTPGIPVEVSGALLAPYLHTSNLAITGFDVGAYERNKILPEGPATICVEIVNFSGVDQALLANSTCAQTWFSLYEPPLLNLPFCGTEINATDPQGVLFSWTPLHMASPFAGETTYLFELFEIRPDGSDPNLVVNSSLPIYTETTNFTFINYGIMQPPLQVGMTYVWRVKARDPSGRELYRNNGYTAVCTFTYGSIAGSIIGDYTMELESNGTGVRQGLAWWNASDLFTSYHLEVRKTGNPAYKWFPYSIETGQYKINSLEPLTEYECRVKGMAGEASTPWSNTSVFTTQANPNYTCGTTALPGRAASIVPLKNLLPGNIVALGQFEMRVIFAEETGIPGEFSGAGRIEIPFMLVSMNATFDRILIDEDMVMHAGRVDIISEGMDDWLPEETEFYIEGIVDRVEFNDEDSTFTLYFGDEERTFEFEFDGPITVYDEAGYVYTLNRDGTYTRVMGGTHDNDVLDATANYQIVFEPSEDQTYGFDEFTYANWSDNYPFITLRDSSIYRPPYKAMGSRNSDEIIAKIRSNDPIEAPYFETSLGEALTSHQINDTTYRVELGEYVVTKDLYAFDSEGAKIGKAYLPIYASYVRKLKIVPVNGATPPADLQSQINTIFRQTNRAFEVDIATNYDYEFDLNDNGLDAPEGELMSRYSNEMRVLRDAYFEDSTQANRTYYIFVVPDFNDDSKGYMVRGKAVGFIAEGESARTYAHELGHGAFGLRHTFDEVPQGTTNNLMDYGEGVHLTHAQWDEIQSFSPVFSILDDDEDGASVGLANLSSLTHFLNESAYFTFIDPNGRLVSILNENLTYVIFTDMFDQSKDGVLKSFAIGGQHYEAEYIDGDFNGYLAEGIYYTDQPVSDPNLIEHVLYGVACFQDEKRVYRIYDIGAADYLSGSIIGGYEINTEHLHKSNEQQSINQFFYDYSLQEYETVQVNFNDDISIKEITIALHKLSEEFLDGQNQFCGEYYSKARKIAEILILQPQLAECLDEILDNFKYFTHLTKDPHNNELYIEKDQLSRLDSKIHDLTYFESNTSYESMDDFFADLYLYFGALNDGLDELNDKLSLGLEFNDDIDIGELASELFDNYAEYPPIYQIHNCLLSELSSQNRRDILSSYDTWTLSGEKEDLLLATLKSTPVDQYESVLNFFGSNGTRRLDIITELTGDDEAEFASILAYIVLVAKQEQYRDLTDQTTQKVQQLNKLENDCGNEVVHDLILVSCHPKGITQNITPLYIGEKFYPSCSDARDKFLQSPYSQNIIDISGHEALYLNKLTFNDDEYFYYDIYTNEFIYFDPFDLVPFSIKDHDQIANFDGDLLKAGSIYWAPAFFVEYIQEIQDFNETMQDLELAMNIGFAAISTYALLQGDLTGSAARVFWTISESISLTASTVETAIILRTDFLEKNGNAEEYKAYQDFLTANSNLINTLRAVDVSFGLTNLTKQLLNFRGLKRVNELSINNSKPINIDNSTYNVDEIINDGTTYRPNYNAEGEITNWSKVDEAGELELVGNMATVFGTEAKLSRNIPGTDRSFAQVLTELENAINSLKSLKKIGKLKGLLSELEDTYATIKINANTYGDLNLFVVKNKKLALILPQNPEVVYGDLAEIVFTEGSDFYIKPNSFNKDFSGLTLNDFKKWTDENPSFPIVSGASELKIQDVDAAVKQGDFYTVKSGSNYHIVPSLIKNIENTLQLSRGLDGLLTFIYDLPWTPAQKNLLKADLAENAEFALYLTSHNDDWGSLCEAWGYFKNGTVSKIIRTSPEWLTKLSDDLNNPKYKLAELFDESPEDVLNIWKKLKDDPYWAQDFVKETTDPRWLKWKNREFFIEVTSKGRAFEAFVYDNLAMLRSKILVKYNGIDINDYEIFTQVQLKTGVGDEYFVADMVLVKRKMDEFGNIILDMDNAIVVETKLNYGTNLTTPQGNGLTKVQSNSNTFDIRSRSTKSKSETYTISNTEDLKINDFIKVWSDGTGKTIDNVISLK